MGTVHESEDVSQQDSPQVLDILKHLKIEICTENPVS